MTDRDSKGDSRKDALLDQGEVSAEAGQDSSQEQAQLHVSHGRGGQEVDGADPSDEQIDEHVSGDNQPGAKNSEINRES